MLVDGRPQDSRVTAIGLYGTALEVGYGSKGGWTVLGPERVITRSPVSAGTCDLHNQTMTITVLRERAA